jgi:uncharacterized protein (TIGR00251 family)
MPAISKDKNGKVVLKIKVHHKASRAKIVANDEFFDIYVTEVPEKGKANASVVKLLSKEFKVAKTKFTIVAGETSKIKTVVVDVEEL